MSLVRVFNRGKLLVEFEADGHPTAVHVTSSDGRGCAAYILRYLCQMELCTCSKVKDREMREGTTARIEQGET
jgi:hypothetical protein